MCKLLVSRIVTGDYNCLLRIIIRIIIISLFNEISTFAGYLMPKPFLKKNSNGII